MIRKLIEAAKRKGDGDDGDGSDRISELPESILLRILCFLSPKKAVQTSVLSKSWRHLGPTRPVIDLRGGCCFRHVTGFCENCFNGNNEAFMSVLENTFQRYHDRNLSTQEVRLQMFEADSKSNSLLRKWIPIFVRPNSCLTTFCLEVVNFIDIDSVVSDNWTCLDLPSAVFKAESLENLYLHRCKISSLIENVVLLQNLKKLTLSYVYVDDESLKKIMSGCPLVRYVELKSCKGSKTISVANENWYYLKDFKFSGRYFNYIEIEIEGAALHSIHIERSSKWKLSRNNYFPHLKSLYLLSVQLKMSSGSFEYFSGNFPLLEKLTLLYCDGFEEIKLFSHSLKHLTIGLKSSIKVDIDAPNILCFMFSGGCFPTTLYLTAASREKSQITLDKSGLVYGH